MCPADPVALLSLALLSALTLFALLTLTLLATLTVCGALQLFTQTFDLIQGLLDAAGLLVLVVTRSGCGFGVLHLVSKFLEPGGYRSFVRREIRPVAIAKVPGDLLHAQLQFVLLHVAESFPSFADASRWLPAMLRAALCMSRSRRLRSFAI